VPGGGGGGKSAASLVTTIDTTSHAIAKHHLDLLLHSEINVISAEVPQYQWLYARYKLCSHYYA
jgi:hypothetical protein